MHSRFDSIACIPYGFVCVFACFVCSVHVCCETSFIRIHLLFWLEYRRNRLKFIQLDGISIYQLFKDFGRNLPTFSTFGPLTFELLRLMLLLMLLRLLLSHNLSANSVTVNDDCKCVVRRFNTFLIHLSIYTERCLNVCAYTQHAVY